MISQAKLNAMPRRTATGIAEERFQRQARTMQVGPSGLPIPRAKAAYRPSDSDLLNTIHRTAFGAYERKALPWERVQQAASILVADIERRYPHADMLVLERYGLASMWTKLHISLPGHLHYRIDLDQPVLAVERAMSFTCSPATAGVVAPVPDSLSLFFARVTDIEQERADMRIKAGIMSWPADFRRRHQRLPRWQEIEEAWPVVGNWLADERKRLEATNG